MMRSAGYRLPWVCENTCDLGGGWTAMLGGVVSTTVPHAPQNFAAGSRGVAQLLQKLAI
jgi:hypothetical protein